MSIPVIIPIFFMLLPRGAESEEYWTAFPDANQPAPWLEVHLHSAVAASGTVSVPGLGFSVTFTVSANGHTIVNVTPTALMPYQTSNEFIRPYGVRISSNRALDIAAGQFGFAYHDVYEPLENSELGTEYRLLAAPGKYFGGGTFAVIATQDGTALAIVPSVPLDIHPMGVTYTVALNRGQVYTFMESSSTIQDISGTIIRSNYPIAVISGNHWQGMPYGTYANDQMYETLPPVTSWGRSFVTRGFADVSRRDFVRLVASQDNTKVTIQGTAVATLAAGAVFETITAQAMEIRSDQPIMVGQFMTSFQWDCPSPCLVSRPGDPSLALVPPLEGLIQSAVFSTTNPFYSRWQHVNVVIPASELGSLILDGTPVPAAQFSTVGSGSSLCAALTLTAGVHRLDCPGGFGALVYGMDGAMSYAYGIKARLSSQSVPTGTPLVTPSWSPTASPSPIPSGTFTATPRPLPTDTAAETPSETPEPSPSPILSGEPSVSPTLDSSASPSPTMTEAASNTATVSPIILASSSLTNTPTWPPSSTETPTMSPTETRSPTNILTSTATPTKLETIAPITVATPIPGLVLHLFPANPNPVVEGPVFLPYWITAPSDIDIEIFSIAGERTRSLGQGQQGAGVHEAIWDLSNQAGARVSSGVYIYRIRAADSKVQRQDFAKVAVLR